MYQIKNIEILMVKLKYKYGTHKYNITKWATIQANNAKNTDGLIKTNDAHVVDI